MNIVVTYHVDKELYNSTAHQVSLVTTEYTYKSDMLVHQQMGKKLGIRLNNVLSCTFKDRAVYQSEQFFFKKTYNSGKIKSITRSTFEDKLKRFDMSLAATEQEILVEYAYIGNDSRAYEVQIVITIKGENTTAIIDFRDVEQHINFVCPAWLIRLE